MIYETREVLLKNDRKATFRSPRAADAVEMMEKLAICAGETDFITRYPEECIETEEWEASFLEGINHSPFNLMIVCEIDGEIAGSCQLMFQKRMKTKHRAVVAISLIRKYWNLGIGTAMFVEMKKIAREKGVTQLELDYIEGNERAKALYEKMGFVQTAERPDAIRLKDGTLLKEFSMVCRL